ncbi:MAG TPA: phosphopentomutase [Thermoanaerobaculia bacterium]|nr:phosphopentomutase [Thermoanaerobaculia bacterium]
MKKRAIVIVCDGLGVGATPDAGSFGDAGAATLQHILRDGKPALPNLARLGLLHTLYADAPRGLPAPEGAFGRCAEASPGKDSTTGHWELMGLTLDTAFPLYPDGFPPEVIGPFEAAVGKKVLHNRPASGTAVIEQYGAEHMESGRPIVYTSGDSVFQVAAHEEVVPVATLYAWCEAARRILVPPHRVGRVIARPFVGTPGRFTRTHRRRDLSVPPLGPTVLDRCRERGLAVHGVGKIEDLFVGQGLSSAVHTESNRDGLEKTVAAIRERDDDFLFSNLVDFDTKYGHRNDPAGYARALEEFDGFVPAIVGTMREGDLLLVTADHGGDPSDVSTDHTREYVPVVAAGRGLRRGADLGTRPSFADVGATVAEHLGVEAPGGTSFLALLSAVR